MQKQEGASTVGKLIVILFVIFQHRLANNWEQLKFTHDYDNRDNRLLCSLIFVAFQEGYMLIKVEFNQEFMLRNLTKNSCSGTNEVVQ